MADTVHCVLLADAAIQEIQLELIRRTRFNSCDGEQIARSLLANRALWEAVYMDRVGVVRAGRLPAMALIKLRDMPANIWNVDTLYVLTPDAKSAHALADIARIEDWGGEVSVRDNGDEVDDALGGAEDGQAIVKIWWD